MATASQESMLEQIAAAGERERTGAFDLEWDGARASLFFIFGHANHAEFQAGDGRKLVGNDALTAIVDQLPAEFRVCPWRRAMVTDDTLRCTAEELMFLFRRDQTKTARSGDSPQEQLAGAPAELQHLGPVPFTLADFPPLPHSKALWSDTAANVAGLEQAVPRLPDSLIELNAPNRRGAAIIAGGTVRDAVWVGDGHGLVGEDAAPMVLSASEGSVAAYRSEDPRVAEALPTLWRAPRTHQSAPASEIDAGGVVDSLRGSGHTGALLIDGPGERGAALFAGGDLVAVYTATEPRPTQDAGTLQQLLNAPGASVTPLGLGAIAGEALDLGGASFAPVHVAPAVTEAPPAEEPAADVEAAPSDELIPPAETAAAEPAVFSLPDAGTEELVAEELVAEAVAEELVAEAVAEELVAEAVAEELLAEAAADQVVAEMVAEELAAEELATEPPAQEEAPAEPAPVEARDPVPVAVAVEPEPAARVAPLEPALEFVPVRVDIDLDALRTELIGIAAVWLGDEDSAPVAAAVHAARPGVDDFVAAIKVIASMDIAGHEPAVVRAMAREMHFRAAEVLSGV